jgi:transcriptional regulator with XRE-family HTH domain
MSKRTRTYSPYATEAAQLLGTQILQARRERRWSAQQLADRVGITRVTLGKVERGDLTVGLGVAFEVAALVGVRLFQEDRKRLSAEVDRARDRLALLPQRIRTPREPVKDDF